jgi:hypothetical protein
MGRHSTRAVKRRLRVPLMVLGTVLLLGVGSWVVVDVLGVGNSCRKPTVVTVAVTPDIAPAVTQVARGLEQDPTQGCYRLDVQERDSAQVAEALALADGTVRPQVWIPESTLALQRAQQLGARDVPGSGASVASSPVVLGLTEDAATGLGWPGKALTWSDVIGATDGGIVTGLPDPAREPVGTSALLGIRDTAKGAPDPGTLLTAKLRKFAPNTVTRASELFSRLPPGGTAGPSLTAFPSSENAVLRHNVQNGDAGLVAAYSTAAPALDYPLVVLDSAGQEQRNAGGLLLRELLAPTGAKTLADSGFRAPDGRWLREGSQDKRVAGPPVGLVPLPQTAEVDSVLQQWAGANLSSRVQVLIDVSGSMNALVPGTSKTRMDITLAAAERGMGLFKPTTLLRISTFSTKLDGDKDYREILPMAPAREQLAGGALSKLRAIRATPNGQTGLYDSVLAAYRAARKEWEPGRLNLVVLMTDGRNEDPQGIDRPTLLAELGKLRDPRRPLSIVAIGIGPDVDRAELDQLAGASGGKAFVAEDPSKITDVFYGALSKLACVPPSCS